MTLEEQLIEAVENNKNKKVMFLIKEGANVNASDRNGNTPLHNASSFGNIDVIQLLLDRGADVNARNFSDETPLHNAIFHGNIDVVKLLLEHGSDVNIQGNHGSTLISSYTTWEKPLENFFLLLLYGADVNKESEYTREKINNTPKLKKCLEAFEKIKAIPHLGKLIEVNTKRDKKESAKIIAEYINDEAKKQELIEEFKTIKEKYGSDEQLSFILGYLLDFVEHMILTFLKFHMDNETVVQLLLESKNDIKEAKAELVDSKISSKTKDQYVRLPNELIEKILTELKEIVHGAPRRSLTEAQSEAASSKCQCCVS